jgi:hypothetical protein
MSLETQAARWIEKSAETEYGVDHESCDIVGAVCEMRLQQIVGIVAV